MALRTNRIVLNQLFQIFTLFLDKSSGIGMAVHVLNKSVHSIFNLLVLFTDLSFGYQFFALLFKKGRNLYQLPFIWLKIFIHVRYISKNMQSSAYFLK